MIPGKTEGWPGPPQLLIPDPVTVPCVSSQSEASMGGPGPIRGRQTVSHDQGQTAGARPLIYFDPRRPQTMTIFYPLWLSHYLRLGFSLHSVGCCLCVSVCPSNGLYNTQQWCDHRDLWPITQQFLLFSQIRRDFFSDIKIPVKHRMLGVRQSSNLLHLTLLSVSQYCDYV